jgi:hypothetical protein
LLLLITKGIKLLYVQEYTPPAQAS